ncbi:MAG TPA: permease-like cell division protein FtsX [Candidatus Limnocylindrales bacterium]|nr:permease-like cell division protein FtsX [Candidatus Limnocylindrales bacterium]
MISFIAFSVKRAWQGFWRNAAMSLAATATMTLMLMLLSGFWVLQAGLLAGLDFVEQKVQVVADLSDDVSPATIQSLQGQLLAMPEVRAVDYVSKDEALARFRANRANEGQSDLTTFLPVNPLPASLEVSLRSAQDYGPVTTFLQAQPDVARVTNIADLANRVVTVTDFLRTGGVVVLGVVGAIVLFIIINTIRLAVLGRAEEIEVMRLVGASDAFIRWPFVFEGALVGILGAALTLGVLALAAEPMSHAMFDFFRILPIQVGSLTRDVVLLVFGSGTGLGVLGAWVSVRTYLIR